MPQPPKDLNAALGANAPSGIDLNELRTQIVQSVWAQLLRSGGISMAAGYTQSEGKNYGMYTRDGGSTLLQQVSNPGLTAAIKPGSTGGGSSSGGD